MPPFTRPHQALTPLDHRIEAATGHSTDRLWKHRDRGLLDEPSARLADAHRALTEAVMGVTFYRVLLARLASGEFEVDAALFAPIERTLDQLKDATATRDERAADVLTALEPLEGAPRTQTSSAVPELAPPEVAALLAIAQGAKLHEHLLTHRLSVVTASGTRVPYPAFQRLEKAGLVTRDETHPLHAGQPVTLTDAGRDALTTTRRPDLTATPPAPRAGSWPATGAKHR